MSAAEAIHVLCADVLPLYRKETDRAKRDALHTAIDALHRENGTYEPFNEDDCTGTTRRPDAPPKSNHCQPGPAVKAHL